MSDIGQVTATRLRRLHFPIRKLWMERRRGLGAISCRAVSRLGGGLRSREFDAVATRDAAVIGASRPLVNPGAPVADDLSVPRRCAGRTRAFSDRGSAAVPVARVVSRQRGIVNHEQVFNVAVLGVIGVVEAAGDDDIAVDDHHLVVHQAMARPIDQHGNPRRAQKAHLICFVVVAAIV